LSIFGVWQEMVEDHEIHRRKELKLHQKSILPIVWKQRENFKSLWFIEKSQKKKITHVKKFEWNCTQLQGSTWIEKPLTDNLG